MPVSKSATFAAPTRTIGTNRATLNLHPIEKVKMSGTNGINSRLHNQNAGFPLQIHLMEELSGRE